MLPRGMSRSTASSRDKSACTSSRASTSCKASAGTSPDEAAASLSSSIIRRFVRAASRPPFRMAALPDLRQSEAICTSASGLDSKTAAMTPKGQVMRLSVQLLIEHGRHTRHAQRIGQSGHRAHALGHLDDFAFAEFQTPEQRLGHLPARNERFRRCHVFRSFASRIRSAFSSIASAMAAKARFRASSLKGASASAALLAARHMASISLKV